MIGFTEPLSIISYVLRAFRLRRIFDALETYLREERKPVELIENFKENKLIKKAALSVGIITVLYLTSAILLAYLPDTSMLHLLPSVDTSSILFQPNDEETFTLSQEDFNQGMAISLYYLMCFYFIEGIVFLWAMHRVKDFKEDFNLLNEFKWYTLSWVFFNNLILFVTIQGSYSSFLTLQEINRYKTVLYIARSLVAVSICSIRPLRETY